MKEEEKAQCEAAQNTARGGRMEVAVAVEISQRREVSKILVIRKGEDDDLRKRVAKAE